MPNVFIGDPGLYRLVKVEREPTAAEPKGNPGPSPAKSHSAKTKGWDFGAKLLFYGLLLCVLLFVNRYYLHWFDF